MPKIRNLGTKVTVTFLSLALLLTIYITVRVNPLHTATASTQAANTANVASAAQATGSANTVPSSSVGSTQSQPQIQQQAPVQQMPIGRVSRGS